MSRARARKPKAMATDTRIDRWRRIAEERIASLDAHDPEILRILRLCAKVEGVEPIDLVLRVLCATRFDGRVVENVPKDYSDPEYDAKKNAEIDTYYEQQAATRSRNFHEREVVLTTLFNYECYRLPCGLTARQVENFATRFYRRGDMGTYDAYCRMVEAALAEGEEHRAGG